MPYRYATEDQDYSDYASGRVIYSLPGAPAFPVRLASEIFQRALAHLPPTGGLMLYDPTCGGAYHLAALGFLHGERIAGILASDVDERALALARRNLGLLIPTGLEQRVAEIHRMLAEFGKESHAGALASADRLHLRLEDVLRDHLIRTYTFAANALDGAGQQEALSGETIHLVFSDIPYGQLSAWHLPPGQPASPQEPAWQMLDALRRVLSEQSVVAIAADKSQKIAHPAYRRIEHFQIGKREVTLLKLNI